MGAICIPAFEKLLVTAQCQHALHDSERPWPQTNCSVDLLIELTAAYGLDPTWMLSFTLTLDFEGDHFTFFKVPSDDLEALYGLSVQELAVWDDLKEHIIEQLKLERVVLVEVDGYFLPDTRGVTYRTSHGKTTIGIFSLDSEERHIGYFHNEVIGTLNGADFDGVLQKLPEQCAFLMPYCEVVKRIAAPSMQPAELAAKQFRRHWIRKPESNPIARYADVFDSHLQKLRTRGPEYFHSYCFNSLRQLGANFGLMQSFLLALPVNDLAEAASKAQIIADEAKVLQFQLARAVMRNKLDTFAYPLDNLVGAYDQLMSELSRSKLLT
jgi:hypothetical protein